MWKATVRELKAGEKAHVESLATNINYIKEKVTQRKLYDAYGVNSIIRNAMGVQGLTFEISDDKFNVERLAKAITSIEQSRRYGGTKYKFFKACLNGNKSLADRYHQALNKADAEMDLQFMNDSSKVGLHIIDDNQNQRNTCESGEGAYLEWGKEMIQAKEFRESVMALL